MEARLIGVATRAAPRREAVDGPLMGGAMDTHIGDFDYPFGELLVEIGQVGNLRPGKKLRFTYFTPDSTLPLVFAR